MKNAFNELHDEAATLAAELKFTTVPELRERIIHRLDNLNQQIINAIQANGGYIRNPEKVRFRHSRGQYYNHDAAELVREIIEAKTETYEKLKLTQRSNTAIQLLRQGLQYLTENLDPSGSYTDWSQNFSFSKRGADVVIKSKERYADTVIVKPRENWRITISRWVQTDGELPPCSVALKDIKEYLALLTFIKQYPGVEVKDIQGMVVTLHVN